MHALAFHNPQFDIVDRNGQPWLRSPQIAEALGYSQANRISDVYQRNADEFSSSMTALIDLPTSGGVQQVRIFSLRGVHLLAMLSRTEVAKEFRRWVLDVLDGLSAPESAPVGPASAEPIHLSYNDRPFRIIPEGAALWFVAADVAHALGLRDASRITRHLCASHQAKRPVGRQVLNMIDRQGLDLALLRASPEQAEPLRRWLAENLRQAVPPLQPVQPAALPVPLSREQQAALRTLINCRLDALPEAQRTRAASTCWLALKSAFGCTYKKIPQGQFTEAVSLVAQLPLEGELLESAPGEPPVLSLDRYETEHLYLFMSHYASLFQHYNAMLAGARALGSPVLMEFFDRLWEAHGSFSVLDKHRATLYGCYRQALEKTGKPLWEQNGGYAQHLGDAPLR